MKKETLEEAANSIYPNDGYEDEMYCDLGEFKRDFFIEGAKWQAEKMYSEKEVLKLLLDSEEYTSRFNGRTDLKKWFKFKNK